MEAIRLINTTNIFFGEETYNGHIYHIRFLEGGALGICGVVVASGAIFCMYPAEECNTVSHTCKWGFGEEITLVNDVV